MSVLQDFDSVGYRLDGDPATPTLTWLPREKNWGPNYLQGRSRRCTPRRKAT